MEFQAVSSILFLSLTCHAILLLFLNLSFPASTSAAVVGNETDRLALLAFKSEITEDPQGVLDSWNSTIHFCQWAGVICGQKHQRVITLDLRGLRLAGVISPHVGNVSFLRLLDLSDNSFHGVIPSEFDHLVRLQTMNLSFNLLGGEIPPNLSYCESLVNLLLDHNFLERHVPLELGSLTKLVKLYLRNNNLTGTIPASIGNLTSLQELYISYNELHGEFPDTMAQLRSLTQLGMSVNLLSGEFPPVLYNLSSLKLIGLSFNNFKGTLRPDIGLKFPNLQRLYLASNQFTGSIPASLSNCSELLQLDIPMNNFTGNIPKSLGNLQNIYWINFLTNQLGSGAPDDLSFISSLTNCRKLEFLDIAENNFGGVLPNSITNLSRSMTRLLVGSNIIRGTIPKEISNLVNLNVLSIKDTLISGTIPDSIGMLSNLKNLHLESNQLRGKIPSSLGNIKGILYIFLQDNKLEGSIPPNLGNCRLLQTLVLSKNNLTGAIPKEVISLSSLSIVLNISKNFLSGPLPVEVGNLTNLAALDLSCNNISGKIPSTLGNCLSLEMLYMQGNSFEGTIPATLDNLKNVHYLDVSNNKLSGPVPRSMAKLSSLLYLNLSFNNLEGEMPVQGAFGDASKIQVSGNTKICGGIMQLHLQPCPRQPPRKAKKHTALKVILITAILGSCLTLLVLLLLFLWKRKVRSRTFSASSTVDTHRKVSYKDLLSATAGFSVHNLIGSGNFGTVYKGSLDGTEVAVKVIKLQQRGACKSFLAECQVLRTIRHRNLVKILTACSSTDFHGNEFKALVYQYMRNGSLEKWLHQDDGHSEQRNLSIFHRLNIVIDVASALHYLHSQCQTPVVHCDLKPSNVLLDDDLTAHVSDFGLAKLLLNSPEDANLSQFSSLGIKGTIGYAAPEYGMGSQVSTDGDVYSFGIFLLEILTGKRPTDELFKDDVNLRSFVQQALPDQVMDIVDQSALYKEEPEDLMETTEWESYSRIELKECLLSLFILGLKCSEQASQDRMNMMQVSMDLIPVRERLNRPGAYEGKFELEVSSEI